MQVNVPKVLPARRSPCPIASTLDIVGDKWTLLIIRDLRRGQSTYQELLDAPEGISTNILADRLKRLEQAGLIKRTPYQQRPVRHGYHLTQAGDELGSVTQAIAAWGKTHLAGTRTFEELENDADVQEPSSR